MSTTGGKEVYGINRDVAFADGVVNITNWLQNPGSILPNTPLGAWPDSVLIGRGLVGPFTTSSAMSKAVWIGVIDVGFFLPGDNASSVSVGYNFTVDKGCVALGVAAESGDGIGLSNGSIAIGAGNGAQAGRIRAPYNIAIGHNTFTLEDAPESLVIGAFSTTGGNLEKAIVVAGPQNALEGSYIDYYCSNSILLGSGRIKSFIHPEDGFFPCPNCLAVSSRIGNGEVGSENVVNVLGHASDTSGDPSVDNSIVFMDCTSLAKSQVLLGNRSTIHGAGLLALDSFESSIVGCMSEIFEDSFGSVALAARGLVIQPANVSSVGIGGDTTYLGNFAALSFNYSGYIGDNSLRSIVMLGHVGDDSPESISIGFTSYVGDLSPESVSVGSNPHIWDSCQNCIALGRSPVVGQYCVDVTAVGHNITVGDAAGNGASRVVAMGGPTIVVGDWADSAIAIGSDLRVGIAGVQTTYNGLDIYMFGHTMSIGTDLLGINRVNAFGGYTLVRHGSLSVHSLGFDNTIYENSEYVVAVGDRVFGDTYTLESVLMGHNINVRGAGTINAVVIGGGPDSHFLEDYDYELVLIGSDLRAGFPGLHASANTSEAVLIGHNMRVGTDGLGTDRIVCVGSVHVVNYASSYITALGYEITADHDTEHTVMIGSDLETFAAGSDIVAIGHSQAAGTALAVTKAVLAGSDTTITDGSDYAVALGFAMSFTAGSDHSIAWGQGATVTGPVAMAMGRNSTAGANEWVAGATSHAIHEIIIRGNNGGAINTLRAIDNPGANVSGLYVTYNNGATTTSKNVLAGVLPLPVGSLILYVDP